MNFSFRNSLGSKSYGCEKSRQERPKSPSVRRDSRLAEVAAIHKYCIYNNVFEYGESFII